MKILYEEIKRQIHYKGWCKKEGVNFREEDDPLFVLHNSLLTNLLYSSMLLSEEIKVSERRLLQ